MRDASALPRAKPSRSSGIIGHRKRHPRERRMTTQATRSPTTLPGRYYTDPDLFREELERFYCQTWICAGRAGQISRPADYFLRHIPAETLILTPDATSQPRPSY